MSVEIYSKMIFGDVIHAIELDTGTLLEGWGAKGIVSILEALEMNGQTTISLALTAPQSSMPKLRQRCRTTTRFGR